jgi:hypothetical protein
MLQKRDAFPYFSGNLLSIIDYRGSLSIVMKRSIFSNLKTYWQFSQRWLFETPERALENAYQAALMIQAIENDYFGGQKVSARSHQYSPNEIAHLQQEVQKYLDTIKLRLTEYKISRGVVNLVKPAQPNAVKFDDSDNADGVGSFDTRKQLSESLEKIKFIDGTTYRYNAKTGAKTGRSRSQPSSKSKDKNATQALPEPAMQDNKSRLSKTGDRDRKQNDKEDSDSYSATLETASEVENISTQTSFLPRSILRTLDRLKRELDPKAETEVIRNFRTSKTKTAISLKFILLLILIPLLTHQIAKNFVVGPVYDRFWGETVEVFINGDMEEEAYRELEHYERRLKFKMLLGKAPDLSDSEIEERLHEKAEEISHHYQHRSNSAVKNIFADLASFVAFGIVLANSQREIETLKSFIDDIVYGLSDSAKAFIIILFTDMFVGFHSPHGWEVILEGIARHLGLPESREFNFLFIATFPVILDTIFKYWIFRYLNRISPSAVATYRNMNE